MSAKLQTTGLLCLLVVLTTAVSGIRAQTSATEERVTVKSVVGKAEVRSGASPNWRPVRVNMPVKMGWDVRTYVESSLELQYESGTVIKVGENSVVTLSKLYKESDKAGGNTQIKLATGEVWGNVQKLMNKKSSFEFETPTAVAAIRGTVAGIKSRGNKDTIECVEGSIEVTNKGSRRSVTITDKQRAVIEAGAGEISVTQIAAATNPFTTKTTTAELALSITSPASGTVLDASPVTVKGSTEAGASVTSGDARATAGSDGAFALSVELAPGSNTVTITATSGDRSKSTNVVVEYKPKLTMTVKNISDNMEVATDELPVEVEVSEGATYTLALNKQTTESPVKLKPGKNILTVTASDQWGNTLSQEFTIKYKKGQAFFLNITSPVDGARLDKPSVEIMGTTAPGAIVTVNGAATPVSQAGVFTYKMTLYGAGPEFEIAVKASLEGQEVSEEVTVLYEPDVPLVIITPAEGQRTDTTVIQLRGTTANGAKVTVDGRPVAVVNGTFADQILIPDEPGEYTIEIQAELSGKEVVVERTITYDPKVEKLVLEVRAPAEGQLIQMSPIKVTGLTNPRATVKVNGRPATVSPNGQFACELIVTGRDAGEYSIEVIASNAEEDISKPMTVQVGIKSPSINISAPQVIVVGQNQRASKSDELTVQVLDRTPTDEITLIVELNGGAVDEFTMEPNSYERVKLEEGKNVYTVKARDVAGNMSNVIRGERYYLPGPIDIEVNKPDNFEIDDLPPMPRGVGPIQTEVEIEIEDQIGTVPETILYVRVRGMGQDKQLTKCPNYIYRGNVNLVRGTNSFIIEVEDLAGNKKTEPMTITISQ